MLPSITPRTDSSHVVSLSSQEAETTLSHTEGQLSSHKVIPQKEGSPRKLFSFSRLSQLFSDSDSSFSHDRSRRASLNLRNIKLDRNAIQIFLQEDHPLPDALNTRSAEVAPSLPILAEHHQDQPKENLDSLISSNQKHKLKETNWDLSAEDLNLFIQKHFSLLLAQSNDDVLLTFINESIQPSPSAYSQMLKMILFHLQNPSAAKIPSLPNVVATILGKMEKPQLLIERSTIEKIGRHSNPLSTLTTFALHNAYSSELIRLQQANEGISEIFFLCHTWFVPTGSFLLFLCEEALKSANKPKQGLMLLQTIYEIIRQPLIYPIPHSVVFEAHHYFIKLPDIETFAEMKRNLLHLSKSLIQVPLPISRDYPLTFHDAVRATLAQATPLQFRNISAAIIEGKITNHSVQSFAWDLKKLDALLFIGIVPAEFSEFKKSNQTDLAPHLKAYIQHTNVLISFVTSHILSFSTPQERAQCCMFYIRVLRRSIQTGNLNGAFTLLGALEHSSIARLKQTWALVDKKDLQVLEGAKDLFLPTNNYGNYNQHVKKWEKKYGKMDGKRCLIPIFGNFLKYFTFIDDGNPSLLTDGHLNGNKVQLLAQQQATILKYQTLLFSLKNDLLNGKYSYDIEFHLRKENNKVLTKGLEEALAAAYKLSCQLEPPRVLEIPRVKEEV